MFSDLNFSLDMTQSELDDFMFNRESRTDRIPPRAVQLEQIARKVAMKKPVVRAYSRSWHRPQVLAVAMA